MKLYIIEIYALDLNDHLFVYSRHYCDDLFECFLNYRITLNNFSSNDICICGYLVYKSLESLEPDFFECFENDFF